MAVQLSELRTTYSWISGNRYLSLEEMQNNALIIYTIFYNLGYSLNAIAAMLGNMQQESTINPGIWQSLIEVSGGGGGWGLVQWTPWTNFTDWADSNNYEWDNGEAQCEWIDTMTVATGQWIPTTLYPISWEEFKTGDYSLEFMTNAFLKNFERAGDEKIAERQQYASYWYEYISGESPIPTPTPTPATKKKKMPVWMMCKYYC